MEAAKSAIGNLMGYNNEGDQASQDGHQQQSTTTGSGEHEHKSHMPEAVTHHKVTSDQAGAGDAGDAHASSGADQSADSSHTHNSDAQNPDQGRDPAVVGDDSKDSKLTGSAAPGSHSAVFGLTPDGKPYNDTAHASSKLKPAHSSEPSEGDKAANNDTSSRAPAGAAVSEQMHAPDNDAKGLERKEPAPTGSG